MTRTHVLQRDWTGKLKERLTLVEERARRGYTVDEIAESMGRSRRGVKDDLERVRALQTDQFRRERARERARTFDLCAQTQASLWKTIEQRMQAGDDKAVPAAARALLETIRAGESLRDADEKDVEQGQLTVRDIFARTGHGLPGRAGGAGRGRDGAGPGGAQRGRRRRRRGLGG